MPENAPAHSVGNTLTIDLQADAVDSLFHPFDPSPLSHRAISAEADAYVVDRVAGVPEDADVSLRILLPTTEAASCADVQEAFRRHYAVCAARQRRLLKAHFRDAGYMFLKGVIFAIILISIARLIASVSDSILLGKVADGLSLIVWVALWRPTDMLIYEWRPKMDDRKFRDRLAKINVRCITPD